MALSEKKKLEIILLAAGKGSRLKSALPKVLHCICGRTLLERSIRAVQGLNPEKIVVVVGHRADLVNKETSRLANELGIQIETALQAEQNGTGHATQVGIKSISAGANVIILPADVPLIKSETLVPLLGNKTKLSFLSFSVDNPTGYGRVIRDKSGAVSGIVEEKDCSAEQRKIDEVNSSIYLGTKEFFLDALAELKNENAQAEYYLTDVVAYAVEKKQQVEALIIQNNEDVAGANIMSELSELEQTERQRINKIHMDNGVRFEDPTSAYIDADVEIASGCFIGANSRLKGKTKLAENVKVEGDSLVIDSEISKNSLIKLSCRIESSIVGEDCQVGPFAQLRPGTELANHVKVGNFVEVKKAKFESGAKASHLTYVGDATIASEANLGAGTITCNYDGKNKHQTYVGEGAFIGSNTALVAPVKVGKNAVVGAGSVITKDVEDEALGISRAEQKSISNWSKKNK